MIKQSEFLDSRHERLFYWIQGLYPLKRMEIIPLQNDASYRRYFRIVLEEQSLIAMDAPPAREDCQPFIAIANSLFNQQINVPQIVAKKIDDGFLLLSDFGDDLLLKILNSDTADLIYIKAMQDLLVIQGCKKIIGYALPNFTREIIESQQQLFVEWYLTKYLTVVLTQQQKSVLTETFNKLAQNILSQPYVFSHRDYHSRNLLILKNQQIGILDFQDAVLGPITYDLVSLLKDCYIQWPKQKIKIWVNYFYQQLKDRQQLENITEQQFLQWFDWTGLHRHLRILGTFSRLYLHDNKIRYLYDMPRILSYIRDVLENYEQLISFKNLFNDIIFPSFKQKMGAN